MPDLVQNSSLNVICLNFQYALQNNLIKTITLFHYCFNLAFWPVLLFTIVLKFITAFLLKLQFHVKVTTPDDFTVIKIM